MLSIYDKIVIAFYFLFLIGMSLGFKRFIKNTSDYFRSGGEMLWWIVGAGAFMTSFSAVTFTGMAGKAYDDGPVVLIIFIGNAVGFFFNFIYFAPVFRQMRCVTAMQAVRNRFGPFNEQFFTWLQIPTGMMYAAIWLNGLGVFAAAALNMPLSWSIVIFGSIVVLVAVIGGSWSTTASEFVQMLLLMPVSLVAAVFALSKIGGMRELVKQTPTKFWNWGEAANSKIIALWVAAMLIQKWTSINNMTDASRYLAVKDTNHARKAALLGTILFVIGPAVWFIPPMVARITHPQIAMDFPKLENPQEAAYFAISRDVLPLGMVGLLLSGIFSATMSSMDSGLNKNAGYFVKNFYQVKLRPRAKERELMWASVLSTLALGALVIGIALIFAQWKGLTIFRLMVNFGGWVALPISMPLIWGMFIRRAPSWSGWSTVVVGLATSWLVNTFMNAAWIGHLMGFALNKREASDWAQAAGILMNICVASIWFIATAKFWPIRADRTTQRNVFVPTATTTGDENLPASAAAASNGKTLDYERPALVKHLATDNEYERVEKFFTMMKTPIDFAREEGKGSDNMQLKTMGILCLIYGGFILLLMLIPQPVNALRGRLAFLFCGGIMFGIGLTLYRLSKVRPKGGDRDVDHAPPFVPEVPAGEALATKS